MQNARSACCKGGTMLAGLPAGSRRGRSGIRLAAVCGKGARASDRAERRRDVRLLDVGEPQVGPAGDRGAERPDVLPGPVRGRRISKNVFYTGAAPNQQAIPATDYFLEELGVEKFALLGTDYVYPRTTNNILEPISRTRAFRPKTSSSTTRRFGHSDWSKIVADVVALGADGKKVGVISTINGDANIGFYKELAAAGISADDIPVVAFSVGEEELSGLDTTNLVGHLAAWNYFQSADTPSERRIHQGMESLRRRRARDQ
jgi:ABC-type branched-subunit amino acid transport system substrate-binding protein